MYGRLAALISLPCTLKLLLYFFGATFLTTLFFPHPLPPHWSNFFLLMKVFIYFEKIKKSEKGSKAKILPMVQQQQIAKN